MNLHAAVPSTPQNLAPAWLFGDVMLTWNEVPEATSYTVHRYDTSSATWTPIATGLTMLRYRDEGVYEPQSYTVTAVNAEGESTPAEPVVAEQTGDSFLISFDPAIYDTVAVISWSVSLTEGADGRLELGTDWTNMSYFAWDTNYSGSHTFTVTNLIPETSYMGRITSVASNRTGVSTWFNFTTYPVNRPPIAQNQTYQTCEDHCLPVEVWLSARDPDYIQPLTITLATGPSHGTLVQYHESLYYYYSDSNFFGTDTITFVASDGRLTSEPGTITIEVSAWNDPPVPFSRSVEVIEDTPLDIVVQATDVEGDTVTSVQIVQWPTNGWLWTEGAIVHYTPAPNETGEDSFSFNVCDSGGACGWEAPATIYINIVPAMTRPGRPTCFFMLTRKPHSMAAFQWEIWMAIR